ncbi:MAG: ATP-binding protein [Clostridiales bacterium]|nr:ATP-binding protein [Clostridiales bacterium]
MNELSLYILDLVQNSIRAGARLVQVIIKLDTQKDLLVIEIIDDGCGMDEELLKRVTSPFTTTRTTRKVGLGLPMIKQQCEMTGGEFDIQSTPGEGTSLRLSFTASHMDLPPMGDLSGTMVSLITAASDGIDYVLIYSRDENEFEFDTRQIRETLGSDVPLSTPEVLSWIGDYINEGIDEANTNQP